MISAKSFLSLLALSTIIFGQINLLSDSITFRASGSDKVTNHYGIFRVYALGATSSSVLYARNDATTAGDRVAIQGYSVPQANYGIGGKFDGGSKGVVGNASAAGAGDRFGGYFSATGGQGTDYGIYATATGGSARYAGYFAGVVYSTGGYQPSDAKFKTNMQPLQGALQKVMALKPQTYFYDTLSNAKMNFPSNRQFGLIAQDAELVFPEIVGEATVPDSAVNPKTIEKFKTINYTALVPVLIAAIQEQQKEIDDLKRALGK
jgi:hypothetical protein